MKKVPRLIVFAPVLFLVACKGWSDQMKFPPGPDLVWSKPGKTVKEMFVDLKACSDEARQQGIESARNVKIFSEACMLEKGYIFTNHRSRDFGDYCSKHNSGGGPACKSVGR